MRRLVILTVPLFAVACMQDNDSPDRSAARAPDTAASTPAPVVAEKISARVELAATEGHRGSGRLSLEREAQGVRIVGMLSGLDAGSEHGFHVHENGDCSAPDASSAGGHFNPHGQAHGKPDADQHHAGDMFNVQADAQGSARVDVLVPGVSLRDGAVGDVLGKSIVVHKQADDYVTQPSGNSGDRIACGVIR